MKAQTFKLGNTTIIVRESAFNEDNLRKFYDVCNELFRDRPECFYTREETKEKNRLLREEKKENR